MKGTAQYLTIQKNPKVSEENHDEDNDENGAITMGLGRLKN